MDLDKKKRETKGLIKAWSVSRTPPEEEIVGSPLLLTSAATV